MNKILNFIKKYNILILIILGFLLYYPSLFYDILNYDDMPYIIKNQYLNGRISLSFFDFFIPNFIMNEIYTPFAFIISWLILKLFGANSFAFHFVSIFFYILSSIALYFLLKKIINNDAISFFSTVLYILHPCHIECIAWISGMGYTISTFFFFLSFYYFIIAFDENKKLNYVYSIIFYILAILSQPIAVTLPAILFLWIYCFRREKLKSSIIPIVYYIPFLLIYLYLYHQTVLKDFRFIVKNFNILEKISILGQYIFNSFIPINLCPIQPIPNLYSIVYLIVFIVFCIYFKKNILFFFFVVFSIVAILPYSNIFFSIQIPIADRYLILSSVSSCVFISMCSFYILDKFKEKILVKYIFFIFFVILYLFSFLFYLPTWKNDRSLWFYAYSVNPTNINISYSFGSLLILDKKYDEALILSERMIKDNPLFYEGYHLKIKTLMNKNFDREALNFCLKVKDIFPKTYTTYLYLFDIYIYLQEYDEAEKFLNIAIKTCNKYDTLNNEKIDFFVGRKLILSFVYADARGYIENLKVLSNNFTLMQDNREFSKILERDNYTSREKICLDYLQKNNKIYSQSVIQLLSCLYMEKIYKDNASKIMKSLLRDMDKAQEFVNKGENDSAEKMYLDIISKNKYMYQAYYNLGILYLQTDRKEKAKEIFIKMLDITPNDEQIKKVYYSL